jgi:hypothetical protein
MEPSGCRASWAVAVKEQKKAISKRLYPVFIAVVSTGTLRKGAFRGAVPHLLSINIQKPEIAYACFMDAHFSSSTRGHKKATRVWHGLLVKHGL